MIVTIMSNICKWLNKRYAFNMILLKLINKLIMKIKVEFSGGLELLFSG